MANRVCLGTKSGTNTGLWISKPGKNVLTAGPEDMLFNMEDEAFQIVQSGIIRSTGNGVYTVNIVNQGFFPFILLNYPPFNSQVVWMGISYHKISNTQFKITRQDGSYNWTDTFDIRYYVTKKPLP